MNARTQVAARRWTCSFFALLAFAGVSVAVPPPAAHAQSSCPAVEVGGVSVEVASPRAGAQVKGVVAVSGTVAAPLEVARVKLQVGGSTVDSQVVRDGPSADFNLSWDATRSPPGHITLRVVACGQGVGGALVQGSSTVAVELRSERRSQPIWVGAVVGLSGLAGLMASRVLTGRRQRVGDT